MHHRTVVVVVCFLVSVCVSTLGCTAESIVRKLDPEYSDYLDGRNQTQRIEDEKKLEEAKYQRTVKKENEEAIRDFNERAKTKLTNDTIP